MNTINNDQDNYTQNNKPDNNAINNYKHTNTHIIISINTRTDNQQIGDTGESEACKYIIDKNYQIIARNIHIGHAEIDIVAKDQDITVFIEVRTRKKNSLVGGYFSISKHKKQVMRDACYKYILENNINFYRFDVIEIAYFKQNFEVFHYENVPLFSAL